MVELTNNTTASLVLPVASEAFLRWDLARRNQSESAYDSEAGLLTVAANSSVTLTLTCTTPAFITGEISGTLAALNLAAPDPCDTPDAGTISQVLSPNIWRISLFNYSGGALDVFLPESYPGAGYYSAPPQRISADGTKIQFTAEGQQASIALLCSLSSFTLSGSFRSDSKQFTRPGNCGADPGTAAVAILRGEAGDNTPGNMFPRPEEGWTLTLNPASESLEVEFSPSDLDARAIYLAAPTLGGADQSGSTGSITISSATGAFVANLACTENFRITGGANPQEIYAGQDICARGGTQAVTLQALPPLPTWTLKLQNTSGRQVAIGISSQNFANRELFPSPPTIGTIGETGSNQTGTSVNSFNLNDGQEFVATLVCTHDLRIIAGVPRAQKKTFRGAEHCTGTAVQAVTRATWTLVLRFNAQATVQLHENSRTFSDGNKYPSSSPLMVGTAGGTFSAPTLTGTPADQFTIPNGQEARFTLYCGALVRLLMPTDTTYQNPGGCTSGTQPRRVAYPSGTRQGWQITLRNTSSTNIRNLEITNGGYVGTPPNTRQENFTRRFLNVLNAGSTWTATRTDTTGCGFTVKGSSFVGSPLEIDGGCMDRTIEIEAPATWTVTLENTSQEELTLTVASGQRNFGDRNRYLTAPVFDGGSADSRYTQSSGLLTMPAGSQFMATVVCWENLQFTSESALDAYGQGLSFTGSTVCGSSGSRSLALAPVPEPMPPTWNIALENGSPYELTVTLGWGDSTDTSVYPQPPELAGGATLARSTYQLSMPQNSTFTAAVLCTRDFPILGGVAGAPQADGRPLTIRRPAECDLRGGSRSLVLAETPEEGNLAAIFTTLVAGASRDEVRGTYTADFDGRVVAYTTRVSNNGSVSENEVGILSGGGTRDHHEDNSPPRGRNNNRAISFDVRAGQSYPITINSLAKTLDPKPHIWVRPVQPLRGVLDASIGAGYSCFVLADGSAQCVGSGIRPTLGNGSTDTSGLMRQVSGLDSGVTAISAGRLHICAVQNGNAKCWGGNSSAQSEFQIPGGRLGGNSAGGTIYHSTTPVTILTGMGGPALSGVTDISVGEYHACAVVNDAAMCWGGNGNGQLGTGNTTHQTYPTAVGGNNVDDDVVSVHGGLLHACAFKRPSGMGQLWCWGVKSTLKTTTDKTTPVQIGNNQISAVSSGSEIICYIQNPNANSLSTPKGNLTCIGTGRNFSDEEVASNNDVIAVASGGSHSCAIKEDGNRNRTIHCWGDTVNGTFGGARVPDVSLLGGVPAGLTPAALRTGQSGGGMFALDAQGQIFHWGLMSHGEGGTVSGKNSDGNANNAPVPVSDTRGLY